MAKSECCKRLSLVERGQIAYAKTKSRLEIHCRFYLEFFP